MASCGVFLPGGGQAVRRFAPLGAVVEGLLGAALVEVDPEDAATVRAQELHRELADEAEADHRRCLSEGRVCNPHALQCDRPQGREGRLFEGHTRRNRRHEVLGDTDELRVVRVACTRACNPGAGRDARDAEADGLDDAGGRVAERLGLIQTRRHGAVRRQRAVDPPLAYDLPNKIRPRPGLRQQGATGEGQRVSLSARGHHREVVSHQHLPAKRLGVRHLDDLEIARTCALKDLFHAVALFSSVTRAVSMRPLQPGCALKGPSLSIWVSLRSEDALPWPSASTTAT